MASSSPRITRSEERRLVADAIAEALLSLRQEENSAVVKLGPAVRAAIRSTVNCRAGIDEAARAARASCIDHALQMCGLENAESRTTLDRTLRQWSSQHLLLVPMIWNTQTRQPHVLTLEYLEHFAAPTAPTSQRLRSLIGGGPSVGWNFTTPAVNDCESYHVEVVAPDDLEAVEANVVAFTVDPDGTPRRRREFDDDALPGRGHVYFDTHGEVAAAAVVRGSFYAPLRGFIRAAVTCALLSLVVMCASYSIVRHHDFDWSGGAGGSDLDAITAAILLVPGILTTFLFRAGEHKLLTGVYWRTRLCLAIIAIASYSAAFVTAFPVASSTSHAIWNVALIVDFIAAARIVLPLPLHLRRMSPRRQATARDRED